MTILTIGIWFSSISFIAYGVAYFATPHMKNEFKRFGVEKLGLLTILLEFLGAAGLLVGLYNKPILSISSLGLAVLMFLALAYRVKQKDSLWISIPAISYMVLNVYIFWESIN